MTDKERLESLKRNKKWTEATGEKFYAVHKKDYKWLIKQAERALELEAENRMLRTVAESNKYIGEQCLEQNKRYREAIKECVERMNAGGAGTRNFVYEKLSEVLEGEK